MSNRFLKTNTVLLCTLLLASCGGGGGSSTTSTGSVTGTPTVTTEVINGITVPVAPDPVKNAATLAGVDSNNNGVRDDVERSLASMTTSADYPSALKYAAAQQKLTISPIPKTRDEALILYGQLLCSTSGASRAVKLISMNTLTSDNIERKLALRKINDIVVGFSPEELPSCN